MTMTDPRLLTARKPDATRSRLIHKDECVFSFDSPETSTGLYVSLISFLGFGRKHVMDYFKHTGNAVFLHTQREKKPLPLPEESSDGPEKKITRLAIGLEGGFAPDSAKPKFEYIDHHSVVLLPEFTSIPWPNSDLPVEVTESVKAVLEAESPLKLAALEALAGTWDGEIRQVSIHSVNLQQLENGVKIPPTGWQCCKCDLTQNLWLNLTDGSILCGRKFFDGSGGNNHAVEHYMSTSYPLAVKLGTISADGKADVYSYAEDDMVEDPHLTEHLKHFGIDLQHMQKTEKSMIELELEINQNAGEWGLLQESSSQLQPAHGPGLTGLVNLGNSCYLNSVMQVMFTIPSFVNHYVNRAQQIFSTFPADPVSDFNVQAAKLGVGLLSGEYSTLDEEGGQNGVSPQMFMNLIGKLHPEFGTKKQQDAQEFYLYLLDIVERNCRDGVKPTNCLKFSVEERMQCSESGGVLYNHHTEQCLEMSVPLISADNRFEVEAYETQRMEAERMGQKLDSSLRVRPHIPFQACLDAFTQEGQVKQFFSSALNKKVIANKSTRLATFPDYLMIQLKKFTFDDKWSPIKLDVEVEMPWEMDIEELKGTGFKEGETLLPDVTTDIPAPQYDETVMSQLMEMGFPSEACKRALYFTKNSGMQPATEWIMEHIADGDFSDPFVPPGTNKPFKANEDGVAMIMSMGFTKQQAEKALAATKNDINSAADWIVSHMDDLDSMNVDDEIAPTVSAEPELTDGNTRYKLVAFISHMGSSAMVGHYVCHIFYENKWVIFNDNKVAYSENPPTKLGYLYLYKRLDSPN
ncbi:ubiquitin specific protease 5 isoform X2 [Arctopsyche grandis]|uniref:ubiquitin specific protease 5 isoform X2 n=1 Tax=Arctopsyche grandis TaxID=121162 RepID=UPI00406D713B